MPAVPFVFSAVGAAAVLTSLRSIEAQARKIKAEFTQTGAAISATTKVATAGAAKQARATSMITQMVRQRVAAENQATAAAARSARALAAASGKSIRGETLLKVKIEQKNALITKAILLYQRLTGASLASSRAAVAATNQEIVATKRLALEQKKRLAVLGRGRSFRGGTGIIGLGLTTGLVGGMIAGAAGRSALTTDEAVSRLMVKGRRPDEIGINTNRATQKVQNAAIKAGVDPMAIVKAMQAYVGLTGDRQSALSQAGVFAKFISTGTAGADVGKTAAFMRMKFGIGAPAQPGGAFDTLGMDRGLSTAYVSGKRHQFELPDFAKQAPKIMSAMKRFNYGNVGIEGVRQMSGWAQMAARGTPGGAQAGTAFESLLADIMKSKLIGEGTRKQPGLGVNIKGKDKQMRNFEDIVLDILVATGGEIVGNKSKGGGTLGLTDIFKKRGIRGMSAIAEQFSVFQTEAKQKDPTITDAEATNRAREAMKEFMDGMKEAGDVVAESNRDAAISQQSTTAKLRRAWNMVVMAATKELIPMLDQFARALPKLIPQIRNLFNMFRMLGGAIGWLIDQLPDTPGTKQYKLGARKVDLEGQVQIARAKMHSGEYQRMSKVEKKYFLRALRRAQNELYGGDQGTLKSPFEKSGIVAKGMKQRIREAQEGTVDRRAIPKTAAGRKKALQEIQSQDFQGRVVRAGIHLGLGGVFLALAAGQAHQEEIRVMKEKGTEAKPSDYTWGWAGRGSPEDRAKHAHYVTNLRENQSPPGEGGGDNGAKLNQEAAGKSKSAAEAMMDAAALLMEGAIEFAGKAGLVPTAHPEVAVTDSPSGGRGIREP